MVGRTVTHYRILDRLGEGGMGVVFRAEDTRLQRQVALKFLRTSLADDSVRERFMREALTVASLEHPNICAIHEIGEDPESGPFLVMPCYEGETLAARLAREPRPGLPEALGIALQIATGLSVAHARGIVHRDLKPANVFLTREGTVKILDFGLARLGERSRLTRSGTTLGTVAYMAPEQFRGEAIDPRADLWALGAILYEMIAGAPAFGGEHEQALMYSILERTPAPLAERHPETPPALQALVETAMRKSPEDRPSSAEEFAARLRAVLAATPGGADLVALRLEERGDRTASIAVLPFVNMSSDPENQYIGDGLADELINALARLEGLRVAARTSSFRFRGADADIREIGRRLDVAAVLEGSVRRSGDQLRITAQVVDVRDGCPFWSERFDRRLDDIFAVQDEIARAIVRKLEVRLVGGADRPLVSRPTQNLEAYQAYLEGRYHWFKLTPEGWQRSMELYQKAVLLDPAYAAPHAAIAASLVSQAWWGGAAPGQAMAQARAAAERALAIDPQCAAAHGSLATVLWTYDRDLVNAEREFRRAIALEPMASDWHLNFGLLLAVQQRSTEAVAEARTALSLDPLSSLVVAWAGTIFATADEPERAESTLRKGLEQDPGHWQLHLQLGMALLKHGRLEDALHEVTCAGRHSYDGPASLVGRAVCLHLLGRTAEADAMTARLLALRARQYIPPTYLGWIAVAAGDPDAALPHLEQALRDRDVWVVANPFWGPRVKMQGPGVDALLSASTRRAPLSTTDTIGFEPR